MSEVACLMERIQAEYEAGQRALHDSYPYAFKNAPFGASASRSFEGQEISRIAAPHVIATHHAERMALYLEWLREVAGEQAARDALIQWGGGPQ